MASNNTILCLLVVAASAQAPGRITVPTPVGTLHEMVLVPAGEFIMGTENGDEEEAPPRGLPGLLLHRRVRDVQRQVPPVRRADGGPQSVL